MTARVVGGLGVGPRFVVSGSHNKHSIQLPRLEERGFDRAHAHKLATVEIVAQIRGAAAPGIPTYTIVNVHIGVVKIGDHGLVLNPVLRLVD